MAGSESRCTDDTSDRLAKIIPEMEDFEETQNRLEGIEGVSHTIDPRALGEEDLYGVLDPIITLRHFLDFIQHFVAQVEEMQKSLAVKIQELETKNQEANERLRQMVKDQQEAEEQKQQSIKISQLVGKQTKEIAIEGSGEGRAGRHRRPVGGEVDRDGSGGGPRPDERVRLRLEIHPGHHHEGEPYPVYRQPQHGRRDRGDQTPIRDEEPGGE
jgi:hypothetical protein